MPFAPNQPATPQQPAPKPGQPNYPNIEKFNEQEEEIGVEFKTCDYCGKSVPSENLDEHENWCSESLTNYPEEEPDPSNPDRELDADPEIPDPVDEKDIEEKEKDKKPFGGEPVTTEGLEVPDKIEIPERLFNDLQMMIEYSITNDNEAGGFLIIAKTGDLGVVGEQFGKDREIVLEPNEELHEGESLIGTVHMHPVTPTASTGDVKGYLNDENERVMVVVGADKSINIFFKTDFTAEGDYGDEISENFEQGDMDILCEGFGFIWYRAEESDRTVASIITHLIDNVELDIVDETWPIEALVKGLGIKGRPDIPEEYSTKKTPLQLQIPFAFSCHERRLVG
jgi:proteasome lid subunit RPN8/RPN11